MKSLDQRIHEWRGKCWHEGVRKPFHQHFECGKCGELYREGSLKYTTDPLAYWELLQEVKRHEKFMAFKRKVAGWDSEYMQYNEVDDMIDILLDQKKGCEAIASFFIGEEK